MGEEMMGSAIDFRHKGKEMSGIVVGFKPAVLTNVFTGKKYPAVKFKVKPENGRAVWTDAVRPTNEKPQ